MDLVLDSCDPRPTPNTDISGIGIRIAFYLQCFLLREQYTGLKTWRAD
jgi:hypothetical protein